MDGYTVLAGVMLLASWLLLRPQESRPARAPIEVAALSTAQRQAASNELAKMELRLVEQHRELEAALVTRVAMLDRLIADADDRIADLRQQIEFSDAASTRRKAA